MSFIIFCIAVTFWVIQNNYFGWNVTPKSDVELVTDGISFVLFAMAFQE